MAIKRLEHVGIVVDDLTGAVEFFGGLGLELQDQWSIEGAWVGRVIGLEGVRAEVAMMATPEGEGRLELTRFLAPAAEGGEGKAPANARGIRHLAFSVDDIDAAVAGLRARGGELVGELEQYKDIWRLCYVRGPEGIIIELGERISSPTASGSA